jgi:nitrite reductase/ring-hydroxylating ferredoxin subunit/alkylhydroperoxidase/carboxymuconolactone decarboxylase family protein YurZ
MSDALDYLIKARPDAMGHYFRFLKACGSHLDPKTRDLISVITKVHAQTERGFRQYLRRALRDGCTPMEILDALLMAFPALGLSKLVWATDILLAMNLPGFHPDALHASVVPAGDATGESVSQDSAAAWHDLIAADAVAIDTTVRLEPDGRSVFVHRDEDGFAVYDSRCPHQTTDIPHLALDGHTLTCPKHRWAFDIRSGECTAVGDRPLRAYDCRVQAGRLLAHW